MYQHPGVGQRIRCFLHFKLRAADFHSRALSLVKNLSRLIDAGYQLIDLPAHLAGCNEALVSTCVTGDADRLLTRADHFIARLGDKVITVTLDTFAKLLLVKRCFVRTGLKQLSLPSMTLSANIRH